MYYLSPESSNKMLAAICLAMAATEVPCSDLGSPMSNMTEPQQMEPGSLHLCMEDCLSNIYKRLFISENKPPKYESTEASEFICYNTSIVLTNTKLHDWSLGSHITQ